MTYNRVLTPRAYMDRLSFDLANGWRTISNYSITSLDTGSAVTPSSGSFEDLFDLRPSNYITVAANTETFYIDINTGASSDTTAEANFLAILGHNFDDATARFKILHDDASDFGTATTVTASGGHTDVINGDASGDWIDPAANGWTLVTWANNNTDNQYYRIYIEDDNGAASDFAEAVQIGAIMLGEYIDFPNSPDLDVGFSIDYDGSKLLTSAGGNTFAASSYLGSPPWAATNPWVLTAEAGAEAYKMARHYGRRRYDMNFSYVADTNLFQSNMHSAHGAMIDGSDLYSQFYHKALGQHLPFLFTIDGSSTSEGDYGLYRLADSEIKTKQVAHQAWNTSLSLVESW